MGMNQLTNLIYKKLWVVLLFSLGCSLLAGALLFILAPVLYQSGTTLYISNKSFKDGSEITYGDMLAGRSLAENYEEIVKSGMFAGLVIKKEGLSGISPEALQSRIEAGTLKNSNVLEIKVSYPDKALAKRIAQAFPEVLNEKSFALSGAEHVMVLNKPYDAKPLYTGKLIAILAAFFSGLVLSAGFLLITPRGNSIIRTPEDVEHYLGLTVTGTIPDYML